MRCVLVRYSLNMTYDWSVLHKPIYRSRKGATFSMWVTTLTGYLISKVTNLARAMTNNHVFAFFFFSPALLYYVTKNRFEFDSI